MLAGIWRINLLGTFSVQQDGNSVTHFRTRKTAALLALIACLKIAPSAEKN